MIAGRDAPTHGEAKNSWLTGTAAWNFAAISQYVIGIRPELNGLRIAPVIPSAWEGFRAIRKYRGVTYEIEVTRTGKGNRTAVSVDGKPIEGTLIPLPPAGKKTVQVKVELS